jgi:DNA polymerase III epsilon subunit-like protein
MIVIDVETTGLSSRYHAMVSIGAVDFANPDRQFSDECQAWEGAEISPQALEVNGFTLEAVKDISKKPLKELMQAFIAWVGESEDQTIAGQNPSFDYSFLRSSAERCGLAWYPSRRTIDLHALCYTHHYKRGIKPPLKDHGSAVWSDYVMEYVGLPTEPRPHIAINGSRWEAEAFSRLIHGKSLLPEFSQYPLPGYLS